MNRERALVEAGQVEQVADEPLEPLRLLDDDRRRLRDRHHAVEERLAVAADRGQRRLELVADREQERALGVLRAVEVVGELVEALGERGDLGRALLRERAGALAGGEREARLRDALDRPRDGPGEQERGEGGDRRADRGGDPEGDRERLEIGGLERRRAQQDDGLPALRMGGVEVAVAADVDRALRGLPVAEGGAAVGRQQQRGLLQRQDRHPLLLGVEEDAEARELLRRPGRRRCCSAISAAWRASDLSASWRAGFRTSTTASTSVTPDGSHDRESDRDELARAERPHGSVGWTALYPAPRTVRIRSGRASLRRSCATWTSTVRVPPA